MMKKKNKNMQRSTIKRCSHHPYGKHSPCTVGTLYFVFAPDCPLDRTTIFVFKGVGGGGCNLTSSQPLVLPLLQWCSGVTEHVQMCVGPTNGNDYEHLVKAWSQNNFYPKVVKARNVLTKPLYDMIGWLNHQCTYMRSDTKLHYQDVLDDLTNG